MCSHHRAIKNREKRILYFIFKLIFRTWAISVGGVMVSIDAFQALDPGSIPGHRTLFFLQAKQQFLRLFRFKTSINSHEYFQYLRVYYQLLD